jgi:hypothetical protein
VARSVPLVGADSAQPGEIGDSRRQVADAGWASQAEGRGFEPRRPLHSKAPETGPCRFSGSEARWFFDAAPATTVIARGVRTLRLALLTATIAAAAVGCRSETKEARNDRPAAQAASRIEGCTQRILERAEQRAENTTTSKAEIERYIRTTYCMWFEREGVVHDDGTLALGAYLVVLNGGTCARAAPNQPARTVPCEGLDRRGPNVLDCALLHDVRRSEVQDYVAKLQRARTVSCDDGTPLDELGAE